MEDKNIFSKITLHAQAEYKNIKIQIFLQGLLPWGMLKNIFSRVSYCQNSDIREVIIALLW